MSAAPKTKPGGRHPIDPGKIPIELRTLPQWVVWRMVVRKGKATKMPLQARIGADGEGRPRRHPADSTDPTTWATFDGAMAAYLDPDSGLDGIGFVFAPDGEFAGVDFDHCLDDRARILPWAHPFLDRLVGYAEISPSGSGIKAFVRGEVPGGSGRKLLKLGPDGKGAIEVYDRGRYFTVTSRVLDGHASIGDGGAELAKLHAEWFPLTAKTRKRKPPTAKLLRSDAELIAKAQASRNGSKFASLWGGSLEGYPSKSEADLALCSLLAFWTGGDVDAIDRLFRQSGLCEEKWERITYREPTIDKACDRDTFYDPNYRSGGERYRVFTGDEKGDGSSPGPREKASGGQPPPAAGGDTGQPTPDDRPVIEINTQRHLAVAAAVAALKAEPDLYYRGDQLVKVVTEAEDERRISTRTVMKTIAGSPKIVGLSDSNVGCCLTATSVFVKWKKDKAGEDVASEVHPPDWLIKAVATRKFWPGLRRIDAIAECPFPRPDGSIVEAKGYDRDTSTLYLPSIEFPRVPERPTQANASEAWDRIKVFVKDFPFASEDDRVVYLTGLLTIIARPAIVGPVPGIAVIGNKASTGKGLLVDAMTIPGTGRKCPTMSYPESKEEAIKVKVAIAKAAKIAVNFDNLDEGQQYGSGPLDSALTSTEIDDRQLGSNDATPLQLRSAWFLTGNNVTPCKDAYRRWLVCNIKTPHDRPEERTDIEDPDLLGSILSARGDIVRDALTILLAHSIAGRPTCAKSLFGSFEDWDFVVRGAVWFATGRDCLTTQRVASEDSPERLEKIALLEGIEELPDAQFGRRGLTAQEIVKIVEGNPSAYETLRSYLITKGFGGKLASPKQLGMILRGMVDTPMGPFKLRKHPTLRHGAVAWIVQRIGGESGESGESTSGTRTRNSVDDNNIFASGYKPENYQGGANEDSPNSPDSPQDVRRAVAQWPERYRLRFEEVALQLLADGYSEPANEIEAFVTVRAEMEADPMVLKATGQTVFGGVAR